MNNNIAQMEIKKFKKDIENFIEVSKTFSNENLKVLGEVKDENVKRKLNEKMGFDKEADFIEVEVTMAVPEEILMDLYDIIQMFVQIVETHKCSCKLVRDEKDFINGIKFVNNIIKHEKKGFSITDLIGPDIKVETDKVIVRENFSLSVPVKEDTFRLGANWSVIENGNWKVQKMNKNQYFCYKSYVQNKDVIETIISMYSIVEKYYIE